MRRLPRVSIFGAIAAVLILFCTQHAAWAQAQSPSSNGAQGLPGYQPGFPQLSPSRSTNGTTGTTGIDGGGVTSILGGQNVSRPGSPSINHGQPQYKISLPKRCPAGYAPPVIRSSSTRITVCEVADLSATQCSALEGAYACGREASECCPANTDNTCFPGAYACYSFDTPNSGPRKACCYDNSKG